MTCEEIIAVMTAHKEGKKIEKYDTTTDEWYEVPDPVWDFFHYTYRVKPDPHYRPFENADEVMEAIKEHGDWVKAKDGTYRNLKWIFPSGGIGVQGKEENYTSDGMVNIYTFADGTPFGKLVEE